MTEPTPTCERTFIPKWDSITSAAVPVPLTLGEDGEPIFEYDDDGNQLAPKPNPITARFSFLEREGDSYLHTLDLTERVANRTPPRFCAECRGKCHAGGSHWVSDDGRYWLHPTCGEAVPGSGAPASSG